MTIRQNSAAPAPAADFATLDELLAVPWVRAWLDAPGFSRFSLAGRGLIWDFTQLLVAHTASWESPIIVGEITDGDAREIGLRC